MKRERKDAVKLIRTSLKQKIHSKVGHSICSQLLDPFSNNKISQRGMTLALKIFVLCSLGGAFEHNFGPGGGILIKPMPVGLPGGIL